MVLIIDPWSKKFVDDLLSEFEEDWHGIHGARAARRNDPRGEFFSVLSMPVPDAVKSPEWRCSPVPRDLLDRKVEITGPAVDAKMAITAANSGASGYMVDGEDSLSPTWKNVVATQENLWGLVHGTLKVTVGGKEYKLSKKRAVLHYRPRGLHMVEKNWREGVEVPACLVDAGLYLYHNAKALIDRGSGPYIYIAKLETEFEARFWDRVMRWIEENLELPLGSIKLTVLVETLPAAMRLEPIVWALRERLVGLNVGRWDYIFSMIKTLKKDPGFILPDRSSLVMSADSLVEYARWVINVAHRRGIHAIGGMAANVPSRKDPVAAAAAYNAVRNDKEREVVLGHDGTWVAHPDLVSIAMETFANHLKGKNDQRHIIAGAAELDIEKLIGVVPGSVTESGVRDAVKTALLYIDAWLGGNGCVAIGGKMEDAATAEISRTLLWQWVEKKAIMDDGRCVTRELVEDILKSETEVFTASGMSPKPESLQIILDSLKKNPPDFITIPGYAVLTKKK